MFTAIGCQTYKVQPMDDWASNRRGTKMQKSKFLVTDTLVRKVSALALLLKNLR